MVRTCLNGVLVQDKDFITDAKSDLKTATKTAPTAQEIEDLIFASKLCKHTKSNTIVLAKNKQLCASGTGHLNGAVMASDAFFPFPDCVEIAHKSGISSVIQPGGSIKDDLSVDYCNNNGISMVMTGTRHFKH